MEFYVPHLSAGIAQFCSVTFKDLLPPDSPLLEACNAMGYKHPTKIQKEAIPVALQGILNLLIS
jgi:superfamily II DNA/RNA helicase